MFISMQGNWTINVKSKSAAYPQRFIVIGASGGNGTYNGVVGAPPVYVTGNHWLIAIQNNPGSGFRQSDTRIKFPTISGGMFSFDIESNDAGADQDFNDLVLSCSSYASISDYLLYGNVTVYTGNCYINPCRRRWVVIDTYKQLQVALNNDVLRAAIEKLYPERILPIPQPDPPPFFSPLMINVVDDVQLPSKLSNIYTRTNFEQRYAKTKKAKTEDVIPENLLNDFQLTGTRALSNNLLSLNKELLYDKIGLARLKDSIRFGCNTEAGANLTLNFYEYDRSSSELAGAPYQGDGAKNFLGSAITDMNGNYIYRFTQSLSELVNEIQNDVASGENVLEQARPDVLVRITDSFHPSITLFEGAPYFNVNQLQRLDFCFPGDVVRPSSFCFNGNLVGSLGNVFIGGAQNTSASTSTAALDRNGYNNHLRSNGVITVRNSQAGFGIDCAAWKGWIDVKGCLYNLQRKKDDPVIRHYTIRFRKPGKPWQFVNEQYRHPKFSKRFLPFYNGDVTGPYNTSLKVDGGAPVIVPAYINIQAETYMDGIDWEFSNLDRYMQLNSAIYEAGEPGRVYFLVEGYDASGNLVPNARDLIVLYIHNKPIEFGLSGVTFIAPLEQLPCNLYKMTAAEMNTPLRLNFKANDKWGFMNDYTLSMSKCPSAVEVNVTTPLSISGNKTGLLKAGSNSANTDVGGCPGYTGTIADFGSTAFITVQMQPSVAAGGWLKAGEEFAVVSFSLTASMRRTNGYNSGLEGTYEAGTTFYIQRK
ncbi:MAG: hypothetical protein K2X48_17580 [Chitinophagaceae bacterium]|nr:hypothetical protein [Chitinophagaceae bacterium]